jgi:nucleoside-diphosphate-sugar epimerase
MHVVVTGGAGFVGARVARRLLEQRTVSLAGAAPVAIDRLTVLDRVRPPADLAGDPRVEVDLTDLAELGGSGANPLDDADVVLHLAAAVSAECEQDFDLGMRSNLVGTQALLERLRVAGTAPSLVFASSVAVFGATATHPLPTVVTDDTLPAPQTSYGTQKLLCEYLIADYTRKGFVRGRSVRLMTITVRPGRPNGAASGYLSGIIREPLAGVRATCPVPPGTEVALSSVDSAVQGLLRAVSASPDEWGDASAVNLPAVSVTCGEMIAALERVGGRAAAELVDWKLDESIAAIARTWPGRVDAARARRLGLHPDESFDAIVRAYIRENGDAVVHPD